MHVKFSQAYVKSDYVNDYNVYVKRKDGTVAAEKNLWSDYYFYDMPKYLELEFENLDSGEYYIEIYAGSFWKTLSKKPLKSNFVKIL